VETSWGFYRKNNSRLSQLFLIEGTKQPGLRRAVIEGDESIGRWELLTKLPVVREKSEELELEYEEEEEEAREMSIDVAEQPQEENPNAAPKAVENLFDVIEVETASAVESTANDQSKEFIETEVKISEKDGAKSDEAKTVELDKAAIEGCGVKVVTEEKLAELEGDSDEDSKSDVWKEFELLTEIDQFKSSLNYYAFDHSRWCIYRNKEKSQTVVFFPGMI
jgi:hypothetical protein